MHLLLSNARIVSGSLAPAHCEPSPAPTDIAVIGGRIVAVGAEARAVVRTFESGASAPCPVVDVQGAFVYPGFNDVHAHSVWFGQTLREISLASLGSVEEVYERIKQGALTPAAGASQWVIASGFNPNQVAGSVDIERLDAVSNGRPVIIKHNSGHALTVNTAALQAAGVAVDNPQQPAGGAFGVNAAGRATGLVDETAMAVINAQVQPESREEIAAALGAAHEVYARQGLTSVTDAGIAGGWIGHSPIELAAYQDALDAGRLAARTQVMVTIDGLEPIHGAASEGSLRGVPTGMRTGLGDEMLSIGPAKMFSDGSLLGRTAAMSEEYCPCSGHHTGSGYLQDSPEALRRRAFEAAAAGWSLAVHAIGDAAVDLALDILEEVIRRRGAPRIPHRIEHGGVVRDEQVARIAAAGIVLVPQPRFIHEFGDAMARFIGPRRTGLSYPVARLLRAGSVVPGSSDRPVAGGNPVEVIHSFVERTTASGAVYGPAERISAAAAVWCYTQGSALATGWGHAKGVIAPGYLGDFTVLDSNLTTCDTAAISRAKVLATIVGGRVTHSVL